jgi:hypothetical protein
MTRTPSSWRSSETLVICCRPCGQVQRPCATAGVGKSDPTVAGIAKERTMGPGRIVNIVLIVLLAILVAVLLRQIT